WSVDRLFVSGDYLLELSGSSGWWGYQSAPGVRVTPLHEHDQVLNQAALENLPVVGACLKEGRLYVAQSQSYWYALPLGDSGDPTGASATNLPNFFVTILDARDLPNLSVLGRASVTIDALGWGGTWSPVWPKPNVLVWAGGGGGYFWAMPVGGGIISAGPTDVATGAIWPWPWWGSGGGQLLAFDVSDPAAPSFKSALNLSSNNWWSFSQPF